MASGDLSLNIIIGAAMGGSFGATIGAIQAALSNLGKGNFVGALGDAVAGLGATMVTAAQKAGNFEQEIKMLETSAGESAGNLKLVSDGILKISTDTGTSADEIAKAMYYVDSVNIHGADSLKVMTVAAEGAKTENANLTTVLKALTTVMTDYNLPVQDSSAAMNGLIATVQNGKTSLQDLSSSMGQVLPTAAALGISFPQVAGAMDVMTNSGIQSRMAAMELAHFFLALESPSGVAASSMKEVGLSAQQVKDALVSKGLPEALQLIEDHVAKKFPAGSVEMETALKNITGGLMGFKVTSSLTGAELPKLSDDIKKISADMNTGKDAVMGWDVVQGEFNFKVNQMQEAFNNMMITLGQQLLPIFSQVIGWITNLIERFTAWESQTHFVENAMNTLVNVLQTVAGWIQQAYGFVEGFATAFAPVFDQLTKNAVTWGNNFMVGFLNGMIPIINQIISTVEQVAQEIANYLGFHSPTKKGPGATLNEWGVGMMTGLAQGIVDSLPLISSAVTLVANQLYSLSAKGADVAKSASVGFTSSMSGDSMKATVTPTGATKQQHLPLISGDTGKSAGNSLTQQMSTGIKAGTSSVQSAVNSVAATTDTACKAASATSKCVSDHLTKNTANNIKSGTSAVKEAAKKVGESTNPAADAALKAADAAHKALTTQLAKKVQSGAPAVQGAASNIANMIKTPVQQATPALDKVGQSSQNMGKNVAAGAKAGQNAFQQFASWLQQTIGNIGNWFTNLGKQFAPVGLALKDLAQAGGSLISQLVQPLMKGIGDLIKGFGDFMNNVKKVAQETGAFAQTGTFLKIMLTTIIDAVSGVVRALADSLGPAWKAIITVVTTQVAPAFGHLLTSMEPLIPVVQFLGAIVGGVIIAIFVALAAVLVGLIRGFANLLAGVTQAIGGIIQILSGAFQIINGVMTAIYGVIVWAFTGNDKIIKAGIDSIVQGAKDAWTGLGNFIMGLWNALYGFLSGLLGGIYHTIVDTFIKIKDDLIGHSVIPDMINLIETAFTSWQSWIVSFLQKTVQNFIQYWTQVGQEMQRLAQIAWAYVQALFQQAWNKYILPGLTAIANGVSNWWKTETAAWQKLAQDLWKVISDVFTGAWPQLSADLATLAKDFQTWFTNEATQWGTWALNMMKMFGQGIQSGITQFLQPALNSVTTAISNVLAMFSPAKTGPLSTANQWMPNMMKMFASGISAGTSGVTSKVNAMATQVSSQISDMTSKVSNSSNQMRNSLNSVGQDITNAQARVSAAINTLKSDAQSAVAEIQGNLTAEKSLITQLIGYLTQQMQQMGQMIQKVEAQAAQATSKVGQDLQNSNQAGKAIQVDLNLSDKATAAAWQNQLQAVKSAEQSMTAQGMSLKAQSTALAAANKAGNDAYLSTLAATGSQSAALKAETNAFNASIKQSEASSSAQKSLTSAQTSATGAQTSSTAAQTSQQGAQLSGVNAVIAKAQEFIAGASAYSSAIDSGYSKQNAQSAQTAASQAAASGSRAEVSAGLSQAQQIMANAAANNAYTAAFNAAADAHQSFAQAQAAGLGAMNASLKASIAADQAQNAATSSEDAGMAAGQAAQQASASMADYQAAQQSAQQSMQQAGLSQQQMQAATQAASEAAMRAEAAAYQAGASKQGQLAAATAAYSATIQATIAKDKAYNAQQGASSASSAAATSASAAMQSATGAKTSAQGAAQAKVSQTQADVSVQKVSQDNQQATGMIASLKADVAQAAALAAQVAQQAAAAFASMLAIHSPAKEGPLSDSDQWMPNLMKMFIQGLQKEAPELKNATKITAKNVKDEFSEAAAYAGASLVSLKQKGDDIYAVLKQVMSTGGTPGTGPTTVSTPVTIGDLVSSAGSDLAIQALSTTTIPGTGGSGGTTSDQYMTIHLDLDGRTIAKVVTKYQASQIRAQGGVRNI